jgi:hypothetical protein
MSHASFRAPLLFSRRTHAPGARPARVLVLDGNENQAVACVRSLARAGYHVTVGAHTR